MTASLCGMEYFSELDVMVKELVDVIEVFSVHDGSSRI